MAPGSPDAYRRRYLKNTGAMPMMPRASATAMRNSSTCRFIGEPTPHGH